MVDTKQIRADAVTVLNDFESRHGKAPWVLRHSIEILTDEVERLRKENVELKTEVAYLEEE